MFNGTALVLLGKDGSIVFSGLTRIRALQLVRQPHSSSNCKRSHIACCQLKLKLQHAIQSDIYPLIHVCTLRAPHARQRLGKPAPPFRYSGESSPFIRFQYPFLQAPYILLLFQKILRRSGVILENIT